MPVELVAGFSIRRNPVPTKQFVGQMIAPMPITEGRKSRQQRCRLCYYSADEGSVGAVSGERFNQGRLGIVRGREAGLNDVVLLPAHAPIVNGANEGAVGFWGALPTIIGSGMNIQVVRAMLRASFPVARRPATWHGRAAEKDRIRLSS